MDTLKKALPWPLVVSANRYCELCACSVVCVFKDPCTVQLALRVPCQQVLWYCELCACSVVCVFKDPCTVQLALRVPCKYKGTLNLYFLSEVLARD